MGEDLDTGSLRIIADEVLSVSGGDLVPMV